MYTSQGIIIYSTLKYFIDRATPHSDYAYKYSCELI